MTGSSRHDKGTRRAAPAVVLLAASSLGGCLGTTYGTGESPEGAIFREMTGGVVGAVTRKDTKPEIDYRARAPLVEPPAPQLPPPVQTASIADPNWPVDPDKNPRQEVSDEITPEYRERLKPLKVLSRTNPVTDTGLETPAEFHANQSARKKFKAQVAESQDVSVGAGRRQYLTQPPEEYGVPADTAPTEFEDIKKKRKGWLFGLFSRDT